MVNNAVVIPVAVLSCICVLMFVFIWWWFPRAWNKGVASDIADVEARRAEGIAPMTMADVERMREEGNKPGFQPRTFQPYIPPVAGY